MSILQYGCTTWTLTKHMEKNLDGNCTRILRTNPGGNIPQDSSCTATYHPSRKPSKLDEADMRNTAEEVRNNSEAIYSSGPLHTDEQVLGGQIEPISVLIQDVGWKTCQKRWTIGTNGERNSDDDYDDDYDNIYTARVSLKLGH